MVAANWNMSPGVVARNLNRTFSGGYGGRYGLNPTSGLYESRMSQIKANLEAKKAKEAADQRAREANMNFAAKRASTQVNMMANEALNKHRESQLDFDKQESARAAEQWEKQFGLKQSEQEWAREQEAIRNQQWEKQFGLTRSEASRAAEQWGKQFGLNEFEAKRAAEQWAKQFRLEEQEAARRAEQDSVASGQWEKDYGLKESELGALADYRQKQLDAQAKRQADDLAFREKQRQDALEQYQEEKKRLQLQQNLNPPHSAKTAPIQWKTSPSGIRYYRDVNGRIHFV